MAFTTETTLSHRDKFGPSEIFCAVELIPKIDSRRIESQDHSRHLLPQSIVIRSLSVRDTGSHHLDPCFTFIR